MALKFYSGLAPLFDTFDLDGFVLLVGFWYFQVTNFCCANHSDPNFSTNLAGLSWTHIVSWNTICASLMPSSPTALNTIDGLRLPGNFQTQFATEDRFWTWGRDCLWIDKEAYDIEFCFVELLKPHSCGLLCPVGTCLCISVWLRAKHQQRLLVSGQTRRWQNTGVSSQTRYLKKHWRFVHSICALCVPVSDIGIGQSLQQT